ncbi:hypothetical protein DFH09DRAFT_1090876 [Mycena vulgaris]|nr:hypothetical protein DFH09DRAFT_1090876 [Mycena vulgaris]
MATPAQMPACGDRGAPSFDSSNPRQLHRHFSDLDFHFGRSSVTDDTEKKKHTTRFLSVEEQDVWEAFPEFGPTKTYDEFKAAVLKLVPGTDVDRKFTPADLDALVGKYARLGILSKGDYSEFYRHFLAITQFLVARQRLSLAEQSHAFRRAIALPSLWDRVPQRLQSKKPDVHPDEPCELADLNEAVEFVLATTCNAPVAIAGFHLPHPSPIYPEIQQEPRLGALLKTMNASSSIIIRTGLPLNRLPILRVPIWRATVANPGQLTAAQLMLEVKTQRVAPASSISATAGGSTFQPSEDDRIRSLEHEILALRTRAQARRAAAAGEPVEEPELPIRASAPPANAPTSAPPPLRPPNRASAPSAPQPEHPFANARDATYVPPRDRNVGTRPNPVQPKKPGPAHHPTAPIYNEKVAHGVFDRSMEASVTLTQRELYALSPEVSAQVHDATTSRRVAPNHKHKPAAANPAPLVNQFIVEP